MSDLVTTALDVLGVLLVAAGVVAGLFPLVGWTGLAGGGLVVIGASVALAEIQRRAAGRAAP